MLAEQILSLNKLAFRVGISRTVLELIAKEKTKHYKPYNIDEKKRDGTVKTRKIDNPDIAIRKIQRRINKTILEPACLLLPVYTTGSISRRSTYLNALPHVGKEAVLLIDISNCFPSIKSSMVYSLFKTRFGCSPVVAKTLTRLTTYGNRLPQGAPTSPGLCNLILEPMSDKLNSLSKRNQLSFTQYVDDLTFSGSYVSLASIENEAINIIESAGFKVNRRKLRTIKQNEAMRITGLIVNQGISVGRKYLREVQREILKMKHDDSSIVGKVSYIKSIDRSKAKKLSKRLKLKIATIHIKS